MTQVHHVAFAHEAGGTTRKALTESLGLLATHEESGPGFVERMLPIGDSYLQLLEPSGEGPIQKFVDRRGSALHHVALGVDNLENALASLRARKVRLVDAVPRDGGMGTRVAFIHPSAFGGLLVELVEEDTGGSKGRT